MFEFQFIFRQLLFTVGKQELEGISGVILFHETLFQKADDGRLLMDLIRDLNIVPGIKVRIRICAVTL